jgi:hypothetical protein
MGELGGGGGHLPFQGFPVLPNQVQPPAKSATRINHQQ